VFPLQPRTQPECYLGQGICPQLHSEQISVFHLWKTAFLGHLVKRGEKTKKKKGTKRERREEKQELK
jgi:hypothetical protein